MNMYNHLTIKLLVLACPVFLGRPPHVFDDWSLDMSGPSLRTLLFSSLPSFSHLHGFSKLAIRKSKTAIDVGGSAGHASAQQSMLFVYHFLVGTL
jgi:hypothetical protein